MHVFEGEGTLLGQCGYGGAFSVAGLVALCVCVLYEGMRICLSVWDRDGATKHSELGMESFRAYTSDRLMGICRLEGRRVKFKSQLCHFSAV